MENQKDLSLSATAAEQLVELGTAADFGFCQSNRKVTPELRNRSLGCHVH